MKSVTDKILSSSEYLRCKKEPDYPYFEKIQFGTPEEKRKAFDRLYFKYTGLVVKQQNTLERLMQRDNIYGVDTDDYYSEIYETAFPNAVASIKLDRIKDHTKWRFYAQLNGYLMSHNRDMISHHRKATKGQTSLSAVSFKNDDMEEEAGQDKMIYNQASPSLSKSAEDCFFENEDKRAFWNAVNTCVNKFSPLEKRLFALKSRGDIKMTKKDLCEATNIDMKTLNKAMKTMKQSLSAAIASSKSEFRID